jgi:hypothetical protein
MLRCSVYTPDGKLNCWKLVNNNTEVRNVTVTIEPNHTYIVASATQ